MSHPTGDPTATRPYDTHPLPHPAPPPPRRRGNGGAVLLVVVLLVLALVVAGDRMGERLAEDVAADRMQTALQLADRPQVDIAGIPFLTQLATGTFGSVTVDATGVPFDTAAGSATIDRLHLDLQRLHSDDRFASATVGSVTGSADIGWPALSGLLPDAELVYAGPDPAGNGRVRATLQQNLFGQGVTLEVTATPQLDPGGRSLVFADPSVRVLGVDLPDSVADALLATLIQPVPLDLPLGLSGAGLTVTDAGARLDLAGQDVALTD